MSHLGARISALVDGELGHAARDRALAHVAYCSRCRAELEAERAIKDRTTKAAAPPPSAELLASLLSLAEPGEPVPPLPRPMPLAPVVPTLPPPGRVRSNGPRGRSDSRGPSMDRTHRLRYAAVGGLAFSGLVFGTAFVAGGAESEPGAPVLPPAATFSTEHTAATAGLPLRDPAFDAVTVSFGGLTFTGTPSR